MSKGFQDAVWNGLDTRRYNLENMPEYTPPEDVGYIKSIGQNVLSGIESTLGGAGMFVGANMVSGSPDYSKGGMMGKTSNVGRDFGAGLMNESQYLLNDASERQANYGASAMNWGGLGDAITNPDYWLSPRGLTADVAQGIGSSLPTLVVGGIGGKVASPLISAIASGIGRQALKEGAASAAGKALSYMGGFGVGSGASEAISDAGSNYNDILQNLQGKVNPDGTPMYDEQGAMTEATRRMNDLGLSEMPYLMASNALTGGMVAGKMSKLLGQDSKSIGRRALANAFGAGADMTGEGFTEVVQTTLANDAMDKPSGNMWNPREWDEAQSDSFRGGFMGSLLPAAGGGAYHTVFGGNETPNVEQTAPQANSNLFGAGTAEISTQGADIDEQVAHLKDGYQSVIPQVAGVLVNDFGIEGAQISSGFRTREHNKEVGGAENSYHVGDGEHGDALDIVLPDGTSAETAEAIKQRFENSGVFDEVLFHDAGSGYHLHLGGLKTDNIGNSYGSYSGNADVDSAINEMAEKYNLDPALVAAIAEQESGFNQSAQSEAGALGIMQLMPRTAEGLGVDPSDLRGNLEGGAKYLRQMLDKYDGDVEKALAAYNAGPGSLDSVNGDISQLSGETQKYVPSVMERYNKFKNKSGGGISSSGNILDWDSTNEDFSKLDFFPKDGEQSQGTANEFLENLAKLEESDDKATKEKGRQAQDILQQYGDDTEKLTEKAKELGYQQTVNPAEVHGRIPMRRIVSTALNNGQVTFATKKAADIFASSPIGQTMERQGKTFKVTDNFKMNEQVNAISQQVYSSNTARNKTVKNGVMADAAAANRELNGQARPPIQQNDSVLTDEDRGRLSSVMPNLPPQAQQQIQEALAENDIKSVRLLLDEATKSTPLNAETDIEKAKAITRALLQNPEATTSWDGNGAVRTAAIEGFINSNNLDGLNRANKYMAQNLRDKGIDPLEVLNQNIEKYDTTETRLRSFLNTLGSNFTKNNHGMALRAKTKYKGQPMNKAGRVEALIRDGGRIEERGKEYFAVSPNGDETKVTKGEHNYYKWLRQNGFAQQDRAPEGTPQLAENNGVTEDSYRAYQPEYNGKENYKKTVSESSDSVKPLSIEENIAKGTKALNTVIDTHQDVRNAMNVDGIGVIDLVWGTPGKGAKFKGGFGIAHILAKRGDDYQKGRSTVNGKETAHKLIEVIAKGQKRQVQHSANNNGEARMKIEHDGYTAVLSLAHGKKNTWLLTGWENDHTKKEAPANASSEGYDSATATADTPTLTRRTGETSTSSNSTIPQNQNKGNENPNASNEPMRKELIEQAAANEDTWVNSKKSELHLEDANDTVVKLTPQELKYYQDLVRKGVVAKPEMYEEAQEDVGEMDDNVEMSKEQKQLYDESSDDRDMPSVEDEAEPTADEPRTKYSREKSPVDEKKPTHHNVECRDVKEQAKRYVQSRLNNGALKTLKPSDDVNTAIEKIIAPIKREVDNQAARYLEAGHEPEYYQARLNMINYYKQLVDEIRRDFNAGDRQSDVYGRVINDTWFRQSAGEGSNLRKSVQKRNAEIETREDENSGVNSSSAKTGKTYENYNPKTQKVLDMMYKHSSRDKSAFSIEPINPHSAESLKENGNSNTELDRLPKVPIAKLRQSEQKIVRFGKAIGVPVHFVESSDTTNRGVFTHNGEIFINRKAKVPAHSIFVHEFVHWLKASPENAGAYDVIHACLENSSGLFNEARINKYRNKIFDGEKMTDEEIVEEIICDAMTHTESAEKLMRAVNNVDSNLVTRIAGCLKAMWDKFCEYMNFKQHKMSNEQQLPNELSVAEFQRADTAFNKILMNLKNDNGEPVFHRVGTELLLRDTNAKPVDTYQVNPIGYTYAVAYSKENKDNEPIDGNDNQQDNMVIEFDGDKRGAQLVFNKYLTQGLKDLTRQTIKDEITENIKDFEKLNDPVELDKALNELPFFKKIRGQFQNNVITSNPEYMHRMATRYEYARRCFLNDSRIPNESVRRVDVHAKQDQISRTDGNSFPKGDNAGKKQTLSGRTGKRLLNSGITSTTPGEYKFIKNHFDKLVDDTLKHSEQGAFSNGNKYSRGVDLSPSTDGVAIAARANNNLVANMKGIVKKANAKFNPFHHEELENLRIDKRDKEKDLNLIEYQFVSPTRESKKYKVIHPFVMKGKQAMAKQEKLRFEFNEGMNEIDKLLGWREGFHRNDPKFKERKEALNEILLKGDLEGKEFTNDELIKAGYDAETIKGYRKMRALLDKAWKLADETKSRIKYQSITSSTLRRAEADFADLKDKNPFAEIISKVHNPDGTVTINYKAPHVRRVDKQTVLPSELENLRKNKDVHIVETTQSLKGTTQVTYYQREAGMGKIKGYIPHIFHGWYVCKVDKDGKAIVDDDGNVAMDNIVTTANSLSEAAKLGREFAKENPNANYRVVPQTFSAPGAQEQAIVMGDFDYAKIVGKVADSMSMSITDAQAMLDNTVKMKNRGRFYGYAKQRKGFKGFEQNVYLATMKYFNQTARYAAMDSFKRDSISMYNRIFGAFDDENVTKRSAMAKWTKQYIYDVNGTPTWIEKMGNNFLHNLGLGEERAGGRPVLWFQQKIMTYPMTILKLGVFNPSSALLNLTQLFNLYGAMGEKVLSPQAYQRLLHKGFADTFRAMNNKDSELGKLLWKDLGLDYQIGMDVASGYSNAEVNNLASLRGFAGRLAGKSMYLFRQSDAFARGVTLLTAYNKALDEGKSKAEAIEYAKKINDKVNFDCSVADEPTIFRALGPISKVFLQFKKYPVKQLELFQDFYLDGRELGLNRKQAALRTLKYMAPYMAMSGMMGIPFISLAGGLLSALVATATGDDDWDWEKKIKQYMITEFGEDSPITQWWLYGAGSFIGLNLGGRVGVGDFLGSDSYNSADGLLGLAVNQTTLGSTGNQVFRQLSYRNYAEALKAINPTMGNIALAYKGEVRTTRGRMKYQYQNMAERMWRAIGFTPLNETLAGDLASNEYAEKQEQTKAKQEAVDDFLANPSSENAARLNELGVTPKTLENESARRTMNRHQLNELAKEKEAAKKKKKPKTYSASDYLKAVQ